MAETQEKLMTPQQCKMARAALDWSLDDLAAAAGVGRATVHRFESTGNVKEYTIAQLRTALEAKRVRFIDSGPFKGGVHYMRAG